MVEGTTLRFYFACECHLLTERTPKRASGIKFLGEIPTSGRRSPCPRQVMESDQLQGASNPNFLWFSASLQLQGEFEEGGGWGWCCPQKEKIPALAVQDPSRTDHILFGIAPSPARVCYPRTAAGTKTQLLIMDKNPGIKQKRGVEKVLEEAQ